MERTFYTSPENWSPTTGIELEPNAINTVISNTNSLVTAGPGAGKTELLAQRVAYLLETQKCPPSRRILAISFKRDAANNLQERVASRVGSGLAHRFNSETFDSFSVGLLSRFRKALKTALQPPVNYKILPGGQAYKEFANTTINKGLISFREKNWSLNSGQLFSLCNVNRENYLSYELCKVSLKELGYSQSIDDALRKYMWRHLLQQEPCLLTFDMIKRLVEHIINTNAHLAQVLRITYSHVLLDEFQDTTFIQYSLLKSCFPPNTAVFTAVGDSRQRIMLWAGAVPNIFDLFSGHYDAQPTTLFVNRRSDINLIRIQTYLIHAIDNTSIDRNIEQPFRVDDSEQGLCQILEFDDDMQECSYLTKLVNDLLSSGVDHREICFLVRGSIQQYVQHVIEHFEKKGIKVRIEDRFQDFQKDGLIITFINILYLALNIRTEDYWQQVLDLLCILNNEEINSKRSIAKLEKKLIHFLEILRKNIEDEKEGVDPVASTIFMIVNFLGREKLRACFPKHQTLSVMSSEVQKFIAVLQECYSQESSWLSALDTFLGHQCIPALTIHKSKGLEYNTVIFIGLEDIAWWTFPHQPDEETCAFFVAFSRAKKRVYFTYCHNRTSNYYYRSRVQQRDSVKPLYQILGEAGVQILRPVTDS